MSSENVSTRTRILNSAWRLLESGTASAVRISDIAKEAGISRQALYLHFPNRADLLVAVTRHIDKVKDVEARLAASRAAASGPERLEAFISAWGAYIPEIYGVGKALMAMQESDAEARDAWADRMRALREGCAVAVAALERDALLAPDLTAGTATDLLWTLLSVRNWEQLTLQCGWSQDRYVSEMTALARKALIRQ